MQKKFYDEIIVRINDLHGTYKDLMKLIDHLNDRIQDLLLRVDALESGVDPTVLRDRVEKAKAAKAAEEARSHLSIVKD